MSSPNIETPAPAGAVAVPDTTYTPRPEAENMEVPAQDLADEKKAEAVELPLTHADKEAIDTSNIIGERTRHARPLSGTYRIPGDEEGLPAEVVEWSGSHPEGVDGEGDVDVEGQGEGEEVGEGEGSEEEDVDGEVDGEMDVGMLTIK
ncbi:hypothetical protein F4781DRAFT_213879 [Annulohypoxylon bovei var. microspora]|nr:hypothetical protein F4781DRAFT_213879 [Annulohypoxylon bovei var. microspora]